MILNLKLARFLLLFLALFSGFAVFSQGKNSDNLDYFYVRGSVKEQFSSNPISNVTIEVNGGAYTITGIDGSFRIRVKKGDQLVVKHPDFETVFYTIKDNERISVEVIAQQPSPSPNQLRKESAQLFKDFIDSAETYLKKDAERSIQFVTQALEKSNTVSQNADVYEVLGDVYFYWKQFDLAVYNYLISLQNVSNNEVRLKLAKSQRLNGNIQESLSTLKSINEKSLDNYQLVQWHESLGDTYFEMNLYEQSIGAYNSGVTIANASKIKAKQTDLNSKIAKSYAAAGNLKQAEGFFNSALNLAENENPKRAMEEKITIADFKNKSRDYSKEIALRKEALKDVSVVRSDSVLPNESPFTPQKQNYKIGNAYFLQQDYQNAIPFLEKSIEEATLSEDLIVKKDAYKKLTDVYEDAGNYAKALETYKSYKDVVDALYILKEQEIAQAARFNRKLIESQSRITSLETDRALSLSNLELTFERNRRQQVIIYSLISGLILLLITGYFMFKYIKQQRFANNLLALKSLRSQMNPHFIFNALNSVNSFIALNDERTANRYLSDFALLMRAVLENSEEDFIPLEKEVSLLKMYTKLEHFRFKDKFDYQIIVDEEVDIEAYQIPPMLLQPYIENAVWHGLRYKEDKGFLEIKITNKSTNEITISVTDDGIGRQRSKELKTANQKKQNSKGMNNIKKRVSILNQMYRDKISVDIVDLNSEEDTGTCVIVTLKKD